MAVWFQPWDRPEYKEWAMEIPEGYLLAIIRKEKVNSLCARAKLLMGEEGLPEFELVDELRVPSEQEAFRQINAWKIEAQGKQ